MAKNNKTCFFYVLYSDKTRVFDQSERAYYAIYIINRYIDIYRYIYIYILKSMKTKVFLFFAFALCISPLLQLFRHSKVCLLTYYITDVILITIIMAPVIQSTREQLA